jgi:hypothetical protein
MNVTIYDTNTNTTFTLERGTAGTASWIGQISLESGQWQWLTTLEGTRITKVALEQVQNSPALPHIGVLGHASTTDSGVTLGLEQVAPGYAWIGYLNSTSQVLFLLSYH